MTGRVFGELSTMQKFRTLTVGLVALGSVCAALAQFDGPAPLAWRWSQSTSISPNGSPLINETGVYVSVGQRVYALDKETGNQKWKFPAVEPIPGTFRNEPVMGGANIYAAADNKNLYALDAATGNLKWTYVASAAILGQPVPLGKFVGLTLADDTLMVLDGDTGKPAWTNPVKVFDHIVGRATGMGDLFYVMNGNNQLVAYSVNSTKPVWSRPFDSLGPDTKPVIFGDMIYLHSGTYVIGLLASTGTPRWQRNVGEPIGVPPAISGSGVAVATRDGNAYVLSLTSGTPLFKDPVDLGSSPIVGPAVVDKNFAFSTTSGSLILLSPQGKILWNYLVRPMGGTITVESSSSTSTNNRPGNNGTTGKSDPVKIFAIPAAGAPVLDGTTLYLLARDGSLLAFDKNGGVDLTGPSVVMSWPNPGDNVNPQGLSTYFKIEDEASGLNTSTLKIDVDGTPLDFTLSREGVAEVHFTNSGKNKTLNDGRHVFTVTATDWMGNQTSQQFAIQADNTVAQAQPPANTNGSGTGGGPAGRGGRGGSGGSGG